MDERAVQFRVGVVVLATVIIAAILVLLTSDTGFLVQRQITVHVTFPRAPGVTIDTPVRKSGILIGRVKEVQFDEEARVLVTAKIDESVKIHRGELCRIRSSLLGDAIIEFVPGDDNSPKARELLAHGETLDGAVLSNPLEILANLEGDLSGAIASIGSAGDEVAKFGKTMNQLVGTDENQLSRISVKAETALDGLTKTSNTVNELLGDEKIMEDLRRTLADLPVVMEEAKRTLGSIQNASALAEENLENFKGFTEPLGDRGEELVDRAESAVAQIDELVEQIVVFSRSLNDSEGSLGQLISDPDLYQNLNLAAKNIRMASQQLRPILSDVRVFSDKIARDPGRIGVGGAIRRQAPIK